jgi:hypothetical protein
MKRKQKCHNGWREIIPKTALLLCLLILYSSELLAQTTVKGTVRDSNGAPLIGASVSVKGSQVGTITNPDGYFSLMVDNDSAVLVASYIGYLPQEVSVNHRTDIQIVLLEDVAKLDEVVVVAYGTQKKR